MMGERLNLYEELMLLALRDEDGTVAGGAMYGYAVAGAVVAELLMAGRVSMEEDGKRQVLRSSGAKSLSEPLLDEWAEKIAAARKPRRVSEWVAKIAGTGSELKHRVAKQLCRRGILKVAEDKVLWIFTRTIYPEVDPTPERELLDRLESALFGEEEVDARTAVLAAIAHRCGILEVVFDKKRLRQARGRLDEIADGSVAVAATAEAITAMQAAVMVAAIVPSIVTTTVVSS